MALIYTMISIIKTNPVKDRKEIISESAPNSR